MIKYNIYENINLITIIFVIIIIIIIYFSIIYIDKNNKIIEKFNSENTKLIKADYLNTNGTLPVLHNSPDNQKDIRYPTLNIINKSTATFRPCQIHFNNDGTSKYIYEDEWKEFDTLTSQEDNSVYNVPYKKFGVNNNNVEEIQNFNETTKCFKEKSNMINLNTYKYKSNDLINYKIDTFIDVDYIENNNNYKKSFMQMNFNKQPRDSSLRKYNDDVIDSICSYNYNTNLSLGNIKLYRLTIIPPVENNKQNVFDSNAIKEGTITAIDHISIAQKNNSTFIVDDYNTITLNKLPDLLTAENLSYYSIENGNIIYKIEKKEASTEESKGLNVKIYKFNRDFLCSNPIIKSYEISNAIRLKTHLIIKASPYSSQPINPQNAIPVHANLSDAENKILINSDKLSRHMINGITEDIVTKSLNIIIKNRYITKEELLNDIKYFIYKLIIISNKNLVTSAVNLINKYDKLEQQKKEFIDSFNTIQKFIKLYNGNAKPIDKARTDLLNDIINKKNIAFNEIYIHKFKHLTQLDYEFPYTISYTNSGSSNNIGDYEVKIYTSNSTFTIAQDTICDILIVGGGGGGGADLGGGGGGGGVIELNKVNIKAGSHNIIVGHGGGAGSPGGQHYGYGHRGGNGGNSRFGPYEAVGGGGGGPGYYHTSPPGQGGSGGSGGGAGGRFVNSTGNIGGGVGGQGYNGGNNLNSCCGGGGGGGAGGVGQTLNGGEGRYSTILGTPFYWGGGGGGGGYSTIAGNGGGGGGGGGGGSSMYGGYNYQGGSPGYGGFYAWDGSGNYRRGDSGNRSGGSGAAYSGGGGGGGGWPDFSGGNGGSGIVIVRYIKITITNNKGKLTISNVNNNVGGVPPKIIMKNKDVNVVINNNNIVLYKNKNYIVDYASNQTRLREEIKANEYKTIANVSSNNIIITYEPEDENVINFNNARDNKETETSLPERKKSETNVNIYKIATKNQAYLKVGIIIRNVRDANAQKLGFTFQTHVNGGTILKQATDYHIIVQSENSNNAEDIIITGYSIIFLRHISGDIFMKLLNISSTFIYDYTLDPRANFIDIESDYINGKNKSMSLQTIISNHESSINNYYGLTEFNRERLILYNNRTFFTEDKGNNRLSIEGNPNDNNGAMLTRLMNIYNSVLIFNARDSTRKPEIKFSNNVKVSDCIPIFNIDHVTYENPTENKAPNFESSYHLQKVSNNYVYFRYPYE
jgi:hypothetical protein